MQDVDTELVTRIRISTGHGKVLQLWGLDTKV